jgi:hypothetical protein
MAISGGAVFPEHAQNSLAISFSPQVALMNN